MKRREMGIIITVLKKETGSMWFFLLLGSLVKKRRIFSRTSWAGKETKESRYVQRLAPVAALYGILLKKMERGQAFRIMSEIIVAMGTCEQWENLRSLGVGDKTGIARLKAFYHFMGEGGSGQFVTRNLDTDSEKCLLYIVRDCPFARFFTEVGCPELASCFCKIDKAFFPAAIPDYEFSRENSWKNTSAYGRDHCIFKFTWKDSPDDCYYRETPLLDYTHPSIQMLFERLDMPYRSDDEKISHFYEFVRRELRPVRGSQRNRKSASEILKKRKGDDPARTILFMALLRAGGIACRVRFFAKDRKLMSNTVIYHRNEWICASAWTDSSEGSSPDPVGWKGKECSVGRNGIQEEFGVFQSPDAFFAEYRAQAWGNGAGNH